MFRTHFQFIISRIMRGDICHRIYNVLLQYRVNLSQQLKAIVSLPPDMCNVCTLCWPYPTPHHKVVLHSCPLIYVSRIKRHGLYRSAVTFLYSHRHSWRTVGWSGKRFMGQTRPGSLKLWQALLLPPLPLSLHHPAHLSSSIRHPTKTQREGDKPTNQVLLLKQGVISHLAKAAC